MAKQRTPTDLRGADADVLQIVALQSGDPNRVRQVLDPRNVIRVSMLPHVVPLLGVRAVAGDAMQALQRVVDRYPGTLIDALLDPSGEPAVRRRLARVLSVCRSQTAIDGLLFAAEDPLADVRVQAARSLLRIRRVAAEARMDRERILSLVRTELTRDAPDVRHVFTLLALMMPVQPLRAAYRAIRGGDARARGTALEYLYGVLPKEIWAALMARLES